MLEVFRNAAKGWVAKILLGLLVISFAVWGITDVFTGFQSQDLVTVGKTKIAAETYQRDLNNTMQRLSQQTGKQITLEEARSIGLTQQVLDRLIATSSIDELGDKMGLQVGDQAIALAVQSNPMFSGADGKFSKDRFDAILRQNNMTEPVYLASERQNTLRASIAGAANANIALPKTLGEALFKYREETRDARYFTFSVSEADVPAASDADLKKQYESTPTAYTAPEYRGIAVMKVEPADIANKIQVDDAQLQEYYAANEAEFFTPEKRTFIQLSFPDLAAAESAKKRLDAGEDITKIAGELGLKDTDYTLKDWTKDQFLDAKIGEAAFTTAADAISAPVAGSLNTAIFKVLSVTPEKQATLDEVKDQVRQRVQLARAKEEIEATYAAVEDARAAQTPFEKIAENAGIPILVIPAVDTTGRDKAGVELSIPHKAEVIQAAFDSDVGVEADAISVSEGFVWYEVREVIPSAVRAFEEVKAAVQSDYAAAKLRTLAADKAKSIVEKAGSTTKLETLAVESGNAVIKEAKGLKRNQVSEAFDGVATLALFAAKPGTLTWALEGDGKTARIIEATKSETPAYSAVSVLGQEVADTAKAGLSEDLEDILVKAIRGSADVKLNEDLWRKISSSSGNP
jgi:peptidyl-prolyl cis-trans isomerase D